MAAFLAGHSLKVKERSQTRLKHQVWRSLERSVGISNVQGKTLELTVHFIIHDNARLWNHDQITKKEIDCGRQRQCKPRVICSRDMRGSRSVSVSHDNQKLLIQRLIRTCPDSQGHPDYRMKYFGYGNQKSGYELRRQRCHSTCLPHVDASLVRMMDHRKLFSINSRH